LGIKQKVKKGGVRSENAPSQRQGRESWQQGWQGLGGASAEEQKVRSDHDEGNEEAAGSDVHIPPEKKKKETSLERETLKGNAQGGGSNNKKEWGRLGRRAADREGNRNSTQVIPPEGSEMGRLIQNSIFLAYERGKKGKTLGLAKDSWIRVGGGGI